MCNPNKGKAESEVETLLNAPAESPRHAIELAMKITNLVGHENYGSLSFTHGFAPCLTPPPRLPDEFKAWDELGQMLPSLWSTGQLQRYIDEEFPMLDATKLPKEHALRAAHILGITIHAYWHVGGLRAPDGGEELVPKNLERPWYYIVCDLLYRDQPFMGFYEMLMAAFNYPDKDSPFFPKPKPEHSISWFDDRKKSLGMYEYDPNEVFVETLTNVVSLSGVMTEKAFFCSFAEMNCRGASVVSHIINAQEATDELKKMGFPNTDMSFVGSEPHTRLKNALLGMRVEMDKFTDSFNKVHSMRKSKTYVDPTVWAEAIAPVDKPFPGVKVGPSGAGMPLTICLDAFFQRSEHGNFIGKEVIRQLSLYPPNWNRFIHAVRNATAVGPIIAAGNDMELKGLLYGALRSYAGDTGFLGVHRLKMYGYMEFTKKLARAKTTGYVGLMKQRIWTMIAKFMHDAMLERMAIPLDARSSICQLAEFLPTEVNDITEKEITHHVRLRVAGTGIETAPGDRIGVLYESDEKIVKDTLMTLANYDKSSADNLKTLKISLNSTWREAIRARPEYHNSLGLKHDDPEEGIVPYEIPLSDFLRYAKLRPVTRDMVRVVYAATLCPLLLKFIETHRESMLQGPDLLHLYCRSHPNATKLLLHCNGEEETLASKLFEENCERLFKYADLGNDGFVSRKSMVRIGKAAGSNDSAQDEIMDLFDKYDTDNASKLDYPKFKELVMDTIKQKGGVGASLQDLFQIPSLCDVLPPIAFRVYSIASSDNKEPGEVHLCIEKIRYSQTNPTALISPAFSDLEPVEERFGASSKFLKERTTEEGFSKKVVVQHMRQPIFHLPPPTDDVPVIMIAAGSGLAPFRSFWQELDIRYSEAIAAGKKAPTKAVFILQAATRDSVPFKEEIASLVAAGVMDFRVWLSREDYTADFSSGKPMWIPSKRGYVHKNILEQGELRSLLGEHLTQTSKSILYMCSGAGFAANIMSSISDMIGEDGIEIMMSQERLKLEVFTSTRYNPDTPDVHLSDFMLTNEFNKMDEKDSKVQLVIDGMVYDMKDFATRHPGGQELVFMYCGMDSSEPWRNVGHDTASEVKSLLEMYEIGRLKTPHDNVYLACSTASVPLRSLQITDVNGPKTTVSEVKQESLRRYFADAWDPLQAMLMESQNVVLLANMQFWDGRTRLTSAEPESTDCHEITWEGVTYTKRKNSVVQGQMFTANHRKVWNEFLPTVFGEEFAVGLSALAPSGVATEMAEFRVSAKHTNGLVFVNLLEEMVTDYVYSDEGKEKGYIPPEMHALFDYVRNIDEDLFMELKMCVVRIIKCLEQYGTMYPEEEDSEDEVKHLMNEVESGIRGMFDAVKTHCDKVVELTKKYFDEEKAQTNFNRLHNIEDAGGFCRLFPLPPKSTN